MSDDGVAIQNSIRNLFGLSAKDSLEGFAGKG